MPHVDRAVPKFAFVPLSCCFYTFSIEVIPIEVLSIEAMEPVKEPDSQASQAPPVQEPPAPTSTTTSSPPITETVTAEELELLRQFRAP